MLPPARRILAGCTVALGCLVPAAGAQVTAGADIGLFNAYVWRGVTYTSRPVLQPDLWISHPLAAGALTVGGWASVELGRYDGADEVSLGGGESGPDLGEFDWWAEYAHALGSAELVLGVVGYVFPNDAGRTSESNTIEAYARLGLAKPLHPQVSAYYDIVRIRGAYLEGSIGFDIPLSGTTFLALGALGGLSAGQGINTDDPEEGSHFEDNGFTHVDLSLSTGFTAGPFQVSPTFHFQVSADPSTRLVKPSQPDESTRIWLGVTLSWAGALENQ